MALTEEQAIVSAAFLRHFMALVLFVMSCSLNVANSDASTQCDREFISTSAMSGTFSSPGYPEPYPSDVTCRYVFTGRPKERVQLKFTVFNLHYVHDDVKDPFECDEVDLVTVSFLSPSGRYCGNKLPPMLMSSDNRAEVHFASRQSSGGAEGFTAEFKFVTDFGMKVGERDKSKACTFNIYSSKSTSGVFSSPNYPGLYPRNTECHYIFYGTGQERVHLTFTEYDIDGLAPGCLVTTQSDYVELSNFNVGLTDRKLERLCGRGSGFTIRSDGTFFRVTFRSNDVFDGAGFSATYQFQPFEDETRADKRTRETTSAGTRSLQSAISLHVVFCLAALWMTSS